MRSFLNLTFYLLILSLPTQLGRHFWPDFSFVSGIRIDYLAPTLYFTDIIVFLLFTAWIIPLIKFSIFNFLASIRPASPSLGGRSGQFSIKTKFKNLNFSNISNSFQISNFKFQIGLLLAIILLGIMFSKSPLVGLYGFLKLLEFVFLGFYTAFNIKKLRLSTVLALFSIGIIFESFLSILQYFHQGSIGGIFYFFGERTFNGQTPGIANASVNGELVLRPYGTFPHPNVLAGFLVIAMTLVSSRFNPSTSPCTRRCGASLRARVQPFDFALHQTVRGFAQGKSSKFRKTTVVVSIILGTVALFLTMSRVAIILWLLIAVLWFVKFFQRSWISLRGTIFNFLASIRPASPSLGGRSGQFPIKTKFKNLNFSNISNSFQIHFKFQIGLLAVLVFIGSIFLISPLHSRFTNIRLSDESIAQRSELVKSSFSMIKSHPIFGVGLNNFLVELPNVYKQSGNVFYLQPVHNIYLLILSQTGVIGLAFFIWFMFKTFKNLKNENSMKINPFDKLRVNAERSRSIKNFKFQILTIILILGLFDHYFLTLQQGQLLFSFILGLCSAKTPKV